MLRIRLNSEKEEENETGGERKEIHLHLFDRRIKDFRHWFSSSVINFRRVNGAVRAGGIMATGR